MDVIVLYWMTPDPIVARRDTSLFEVFRQMQTHRIRRLPVVEHDDELCGMVGRSELYRWLHPDRLAEGDLSEEEIAQLSSIFVGEVMNAKPSTCEAYDHIEDICARMSREKCGAYPVLNRGHLVGIISESDLLKAMAELSFQGGTGKRITVRIDQSRDELLYDLVALCRRHDLKLLSVLRHQILDESATIATLRVDGPQLDAFVADLWDDEFRVVEISSESSDRDPPPQSS